jgi:hypothetical protein
LLYNAWPLATLFTLTFHEPTFAGNAHT